MEQQGADGKRMKHAVVACRHQKTVIVSEHQAPLILRLRPPVILVALSGENEAKCRQVLKKIIVPGNNRSVWRIIGPKPTYL